MTGGNIRVGMIGCGGNARGHIRRLLQIDGVEVVGLCDVSEQALKATVKAQSELADVPQFDDHEKLLEELELDAVEISTPHTLHYEQIVAAMEEGLHVLCEKPLVCTVQHAQDIVERANSGDRVVGVSYQRHVQAPYRYCRKAIGAGELGNCNFASSLQSQDWYRRQVGNNTWRSQMKLSGGGQLNDSGSHLLDIVLWMIDLQPQEVFAYIDKMGSEVDILTAMSVKFETGTLANFSVVGHGLGGVFEEITIWCEGGMLAIRGNEVWRTQRGSDREVISGDELGRSWGPDANFIASIRGEERIQAPPECGLKVIQLTEAAWRSADTGAPAEVVR